MTLRHPLLAALLLLPVALPAQEAPTAGSVPEPHRFDVEFTGGTLADLIEQLRGSYKNIVVSKMADQVELPPFELVDVQVFQALQAISRIAPSSLNIEVGQTGTVISVNVRESHAVTATGAPVLSPPPPVEVRTFSLRQLTTPLPGMPQNPRLTYDVETILTAIDTGLGLAGKESDSTMRYHEPSGVLFVRATRSELDMVAALLGTFERDQAQLRQALEAEESKAAQRRQKNDSDKDEDDK